MTTREQDELRARFGFRCGYCGVSEVFAGALLHCDHFHPTSRGGQDNASNWIYCCVACNGFKGAYWPRDQSDFSPLHPLRDDFSLHIREENGTLLGFSPRGHFHIELLHLNRAPLVRHRQKLADDREVDERIRELERQVEEGSEIIARLLEQMNEVGR